MGLLDWHGINAASWDIKSGEDAEFYAKILQYFFLVPERGDGFGASMEEWRGWDVRLSESAVYGNIWPSRDERDLL